MDCTQSKYNIKVEKLISHSNQQTYWGVISFIGGVAWAYSVRLHDYSTSNTTVYAFIVCVILAKRAYKSTWLFAFGAVLAYLNPLISIDAENHDERLKLLRVERVFRIKPYFSAEVTQITPYSRCRFRFTAPTNMSVNIKRGSLLWATVKVRPMVATKNRPVTSDYEHWQTKRRVCASLKAVRVWSVADRGFMALAQGKVQSLIQNSPSHYKGVLTTLLSGDRQTISLETKTLLSRLGLGHLLAISGLHVSIVAAYAYWCALIIVGLIPFFGLKFRALVVLSITGLYVLTSGLDPPALRAFLTLLLLFLLRAKIITLSLTDAYFILVFAMAVLNPALVVHPSAQASFTAMAIIIYYLNNRWCYLSNDMAASGNGLLFWRNKALALRTVVEFQLVLSLCMAWYFYLEGSDFSLLSPLANILIIPLFALALPLAFLWFVFAVFGIEVPMLMSAFDGVWAGIITIARMLDSIALPQTYGADGISWLITIMGLFALVRGRAVLLPSICVAAAVSVFTPYRPSLNPPETRINIIDVGQGSAALIDTSETRTLIDTGARYETGFDAGRHIINPILNMDRRAPQLTVLSHDDRDHVGGYDSIVKRWGAMPTITADNGLCKGNLNDGGVTISFYQYPIARDDNDSSCVVLIEGSAHRVLLTGDIETQAESWLVAQLKADGIESVDILIVAHHGSKTSSSPVFLDALMPTIAIVSRGLFNHYSHPNREIMARYEDREIDWLDTACNGGVEIRIKDNQLRITTSRDWKESPFVLGFLKHRCRK